MDEPQMSDVFAAALRRELVERVRRAPGRRRRLFAGVGMSAVLVAAGAVGATASGLLPLPGGRNVDTLAESVSTTVTGTGVLDAGPPPAEATALSLVLVCDTTGRFAFPDGASMVCDVPGSAAGYELPLAAAADGRIRINADAGARWTLAATWVRSTTTEWARNATGDTYGVENENGAPDLIAVQATNGTFGYVHRDDLEDADGTTASKSFRSPADALAWQAEYGGRITYIPVYESDGTTVIGEFQVGG